MQDKNNKDSAYRLITDRSSLNIFLKTVADDKIFAIDTEFMRERSFFAKLCLLQMASKKSVAVVDVIALGEDNLAPLWEFLFDKNKLKVFHASSQDIEIIYNLTNKILPQVIDTQIACAVLGYGDNLGYQKLVEIFLQKSLDKTMQFIHWHKRPLASSALNYAALDVIYLLEIYNHIDVLLKEKNRQSWLKEEMASLLAEENYKLNPQEAWQRIRKIPKAKIKEQAVKLLAAWREEEAIRRNIPRGFVMKDELLVDIANHLPKDIAGIKSLRHANGSFQSFIKHDGVAKNILSLVAQAKNGAVDNHVAPKKQYNEVPEQALEMLKLLLRITAKQHQIVPRIIARENDLIDFLLEKKSARILQDWRYEIFGKRAEQLIKGDLSLKLNNGEIKFIE